jgi:hypothetical protein
MLVVPGCAGPVVRGILGLGVRLVGITGTDDELGVIGETGVTGLTGVLGIMGAEELGLRVRVLVGITATEDELGVTGETGLAIGVLGETGKTGVTGAEERRGGVGKTVI